MATGTAGSLNMKILASDLSKIRFAMPHRSHSRTGVSLRRHSSIVLQQRSHRSMAVSSVPSLETVESLDLAEEDGENDFSGPVSQLAPNVHEVESLLTELCSTTSIVEFELKLHGFRLYVMRNLTGNPQQPAAPTSASMVMDTVVEPESTQAAVSTTSLAIYKPEASEMSIERYLDKAGDGGLVIINSPRVGFFRTSRTINEKRAPPPCKEKQMVKEGQVLCYIEQLGCELPVESEIAGEVVKILREDGEPVGYGDPIVAILPSFPGIKKLQ